MAHRSQRAYSVLLHRLALSWTDTESRCVSSYFSRDLHQFLHQSNAQWILCSNHEGCAHFSLLAFTSRGCRWTLSGSGSSPVRQRCQLWAQYRRTMDDTGLLSPWGASPHFSRACFVSGLALAQRLCPDTQFLASRVHLSSLQSDWPWRAHCRRVSRRGKRRLTRCQLGSLCIRFLARFQERCRRASHTIQRGVRLSRPSDSHQSHQSSRSPGRLAVYCQA